MRLATYNPDIGRRELGLGLGLIAPPQQRAGTDEYIFKNLLDRSWVSWRDGSMAATGGVGSAINPATGAVESGPMSMVLGVPGLPPIRLGFAFDAYTNLFLNSQSPATQNVTVSAGSVVISAMGSGYTLTTSAGTATGTGFGAVAMGTPQVLTITVGGTITLTVVGTPVGAIVQVEAGALRNPYLVTAGSTVTRTADSWAWATPSAVPQVCDILHIGIQPYADGDMGISTQTWVKGIGGAAASLIYRSAATTLRCGDNDGGIKSADTTRTLPSRATTFMQILRRTATGVAGAYGAAAFTAETAGGPWPAYTGLNISHGSAAGRAARGAGGVIIAPGGVTQAERDAAARLLHLRSVTMAA